MMKRFLVLISSLLGILILVAGIGFWLIIQPFITPEQVSDSTITTQLTAANVSDPETLLNSGSALTVESPYGYQLDVTLLPSAQTSTNYIILNHDFGENKTASLAYYQLFHDLGFNVVVYSARDHGETGGNSTGYGYFEKYDLQAIVSEILSQSPEAVIGLHGVGLGGATVLQYAEIASLEIDFYIAQGSFSTLSDYLTQQLEQRYPTWFANFIQAPLEFWLTTVNQLPTADVSPVNAISEIPQPVLLIYGTDDPALTFSEALIQAVNPTFGQTYLVEGASAQNVATLDAQTYQETIKAFIIESFDK